MPDGKNEKRLCGTCAYHLTVGNPKGLLLDQCAYPMPLAFVGNKLYADPEWDDCECWTSEKIGGSI